MSISILVSEFGCWPCGESGMMEYISDYDDRVEQIYTYFCALQAVNVGVIG